MTEAGRSQPWAPMSANELTPTRRPVPASLFGGRYTDAFLLDLEVVRAENPASHVRSLTVASSDLVGFEFRAGQDLMIGFPGGGRTLRRRYTIRRGDPTAGTVDLEFEIHRDGGVATRWAAKADIGSRLEAIGPRGVITLRPGTRPHLFVADDSAMPFAFAMLEALPPAAEATAILVSRHGPGSRPGPVSAGDTRLVWVTDAEIGEAIEGLGPVRGTAAYVNGERHLVVHVVDLLIAAGVDPGDVTSKAYWRRDQPNEDRGEPRRV